MNELLLRRRALMMAQKKSRLPSAYQEVEYLENPFGAYIDTHYVPNSNTVWELTWCPLTSHSNNMQPRTGRYGEGQRLSVYAQTIGSALEVAIGGFYQTSYPAANRILTIEMNVKTGIGQVKYNGAVIYYNSFGLSDFTNEETLYLFARNGNYDVYSQPGGNTPQRIYKHIIRENDSNIQNFVPCYRKSDNKPGMYDLVSKTFFTNAGTGEFIVGPDVN